MVLFNAKEAEIDVSPERRGDGWAASYSADRYYAPRDWKAALLCLSVRRKFSEEIRYIAEKYA